MSDIVERLLEKSEWTNQRPYFHAHDKCIEAAAEIASLRAELAEARDKALEEAVEVADHHREKWGNAGGFESQAVGARIITQAIRAIKSPKPQEG